MSINKATLSGATSEFIYSNEACRSYQHLTLQNEEGCGLAGDVRDWDKGHEARSQEHPHILSSLQSADNTAYEQEPD